MGDSDEDSKKVSLDPFKGLGERAKQAADDTIQRQKQKLEEKRKEDEMKKDSEGVL